MRIASVSGRVRDCATRRRAPMSHISPQGRDPSHVRPAQRLLRDAAILFNGLIFAAMGQVFRMWFA